jgi:hypothetical protein
MHRLIQTSRLRFGSRWTTLAETAKGILKMDDGRKKHIIMKALACAIFAIEQAPKRFRSHSDYADMKELLGDLAGSDTAWLDSCIKQARFELTGFVE